MQDKITLAIDALASAAFIEGGVSPENTQAARELTEQRKRELLATIGAPCLHQISEPAAVAGPAEPMDALRWGANVAETLLSIGRSIGFGRAQQILGEQWEAIHDCAPRGRMGVTVKDPSPAAPALEAPSAKPGDLVAVPFDLISAACSAIDKKRDAPKLLAELRRYTVGDLSRALEAPAAPAGEVVYRWQALDFSGYCYGSNPPEDPPARCNLTPFYRQPDAYRTALHEISATGNLTATGQQFARHLQQIARDALAAAPQVPAPDLADAYTGAREELSIWKRRALEAERNLRAERETTLRLVAEVNAANGPTHMGEAAPQAPAAPVEREDFAWLVVQEACETEPADEDDPECIRILRRDLKTAVLAALLRGDIEPAAPAAPAVDADGARYRWLRANRDVLLLTGFFGNGCVNRSILEVDTAIDTAIAAQAAAKGASHG